LGAIQADEIVRKSIYRKIEIFKYYSRMAESEFRDLLYSDFLMRYELIQEIRAEDARGQMIAQTWNAWLMGAAQGKTFEWMLIHYGLKEKPPPLTAEEKHEIAKAAYANAANIIALDSKRRDRHA
jgi:hypothetical protein